MPDHLYRALAAAEGDSVLHLLRAGAEASLCGIPRLALGPAPEDVDIVCAECIEWLRTGKISGPVRARRGGEAQ